MRERQRERVCVEERAGRECLEPLSKRTARNKARVRGKVSITVPVRNLGKEC